MTSRLTQRNWFSIHQINVTCVKRTGLLKELLNNHCQSVQTANKLFVTAQMREFCSKVFGNQRVGLSQKFNSKLRLHQGNSQNFRIRQARLFIVALSPLSSFRMLLKKIINKTVDFGQLIKYLGYWLSLKQNSILGRMSILHCFFRQPFQLATGVKH